MPALGPTTVLEAVNTMLSAIGEAPVNSVDASGVVDATNAKATLDKQSRLVQAEGWHWNTERRFPLPLSFPDKFVYVPANALVVDPSTDAPGAPEATVRGNRLYDIVNRTYAFERPVLVDMILNLDFEELPEPARRYIVARATRVFQDDVLGSERLTQTTRAEEQRARAEVVRAELRNRDANVLRGSVMMRRMLRR
ncbi:tail tubular protein A [uncultured Caudovirales phage]|uniref:Tail tubular protein A n=1 Tax=uncultured Caudovirales phage TaxID=2100421 RepID=A0A6J5M1W4_9CAUD|nr:tail tubular protein A [uncultured Caudovirales phage]